MSQDPAEHTGDRIADYRKLRHLSQRALAQKSFVSYSTLTKVEAGLSPATPAAVAAIARVLHVDPAVLHGQPYMEQMRQDHIDVMIRPLAEAVDLYELGPDEHITPRPAAALRAAVDHLFQLARAADYRTIGTELPGLLGELTTALHLAPPGPERQRIAGALGDAYRIANEFSHRLGHAELAAIALERMAAAAQEAQDPLQLAVRMYMRSLTYLSRDNPAVGLAIVAKGQRLVEQADDMPADATLAVSGKLHLRAAYISARTRAGDNAVGYLGLAREAADRLGRDVPQAYWLSFGPTDVAQYDVETRVELEQMPEALRAAKGLRFPAGHSPRRVGRHWMDLSRAYVHLGKNAKALEAMENARTITPQQVRYHPAAREVVGVLVRRSRRLPESLVSLATWVGM